MRPAFPIVFLTTLAGSGQGLFAALYAAEVWTRASKAFFVIGAAAAVALAVPGLFAFFLRPDDRAWAPAATWRTREAIALPLFIALAAAYGAAHHFGWGQTRAIGAAAAAACLAVFVCTAMTYASLKLVPEWASGYTVANFLLAGCSSGFMLAVAVAAPSAPHLVKLYAAAAIGLTIIAMLVRLASLQRDDRIRPPSTPPAAVGMGRIRLGFIVLGFLAPILLVHLGVRARIYELLAAAFLVQYVGLAMERWFFFAQANRS